MYIIKNALVNIKRNKGRNVLIGLIIIVISAACAITLAIKESANKIVNSYEEQNKVEATISLNRESLMKNFRENNNSQEEMINSFNEIPSITEDEINNYGDSKYLSNYYYTYSISVNAKDIKEATDSLVRETTEVKTETNTKTEMFKNGDFPGMPGGMPGGYNGNKTTTSKKTTTTKTEKIFNEKASGGAFTLTGYSSYEDMKNFIDGTYTIVEGEVSSDFEASNCVISEELATLNDLKVGDVITIVDSKDESKTYELTITGIYKENTDSSNNMANMFTNSANEIITNNTVIKNILSNNEKLEATITPTFILKNKDSLDGFKNEIKEKGLSDFYEIEDNIDDIENATKSINNVKTFATTFLIITLIIGGIVLIVINMINIRERKYEIGVLRTIGMKKSIVSLQFMFELLVVCVISLVIGAGIGSYTSVPVANKLLENEISNANTKYENINNNFGGMPNFGNGNMPNNRDKKANFGIATVNQIDDINAVVDFSVYVKLLGIGVMLTLLGSLASMVAISRFSPLTILKERS